MLLGQVVKSLPQFCFGCFVDRQRQFWSMAVVQRSPSGISGTPDGSGVSWACRSASCHGPQGVTFYRPHICDLPKISLIGGYGFGLPGAERISEPGEDEAACRWPI
jgi:hypothetical protein